MLIEPHYIGLLPIPANGFFIGSIHEDEISINKTVLELFLEYEETMDPYKHEDILKAYVLYYINAGCFDYLDESGSREQIECYCYGTSKNLAFILLYLLDLNIEPFVKYN